MRGEAQDLEDTNAAKEKEDEILVLVVDDGIKVVTRKSESAAAAQRAGSFTLLPHHRRSADGEAGNERRRHHCGAVRITDLLEEIGADGDRDLVPTRSSSAASGSTCLRKLRFIVFPSVFYFLSFPVSTYIKIVVRVCPSETKSVVAPRYSFRLHHETKACSVV